MAAAPLLDSYSHFVLSRQAMRCSVATLAFYRYTAGAFLQWSDSQGVTAPAEITTRLVHEYLAKLVGEGKSATTVHDHARAIRILLRFWHAEGYLPSPVAFAMPLLEKKRPVLTPDELALLIASCDHPRDKAIVLFMANSGLRRGEVSALNCSDVDIAAGLVHVHQGKGRKDRSAVVGPITRRALLSYGQAIHRDLQSPGYTQTPFFLLRDGSRLTGAAIMLMFRRLSARSGIHVTAHALRRTFVILYLRAGGDVLHLQALLGHSSLEVVKYCAQMIDDDLLQDHHAHSPIDNLARLRQESVALRAFPKAAPRPSRARRTSGCRRSIS